MIRYEFDSWSAFVAQANRKPAWPDAASHRLGSAEIDQGTHTFEQAVELGRQGWPEGAAQLDALRARLSHSVSGRAYRQEIGYSVMGPGVLDIGRYSQDHPQSMMVWQDSEQVIEAATNPDIVTIVLNIGASASVSREAIFKKGAAAAILTDCLEAAGKRVELILVHANGRRLDPPSILTKILVKRPEDPLDMDLLAFGCCHAATLRRLHFSLREQAPEEVRLAVGIRVHGNYGMSLPYPEEERGDAIYIGESFTGEASYSDEGVVQWVADQLREQGVEAEIDAEG